MLINFIIVLISEYVCIYIKSSHCIHSFFYFLAVSKVTPPAMNEIDETITILWEPTFHIFTSIPVILPQSSPPQGLWDLSSPTRNWTQATAMKELILITGPSGKSLYPLNVHSTVNYNSVREKEQKSSKRYRQNHKAYPWKTAHGPSYDRDSAFNSWRQRHEEMWDNEREQNQGHRSAMGLDTPPGQGTGKEDAIH